MNFRNLVGGNIGKYMKTLFYKIYKIYFKSSHVEVIYINLKGGMTLLNINIFYCHIYIENTYS